MAAMTGVPKPRGMGHTCHLSRFRREILDFEDFPDHPISTKNLPISRFRSRFYQFKDKHFEKLFNFVCQYLLFLKGKEYSSTPALTDLIFFKSFHLKVNV